MRDPDIIIDPQVLKKRGGWMWKITITGRSEHPEEIYAQKPFATSKEAWTELNEFLKKLGAVPKKVRVLKVIRGSEL